MSTTKKQQKTTNQNKQQFHQQQNHNNNNEQPDWIAPHGGPPPSPPPLRRSTACQDIVLSSSHLSLSSFVCLLQDNLGEVIFLSRHARGRRNTWAWRLGDTAQNNHEVMHSFFSSFLSVFFCFVFSLLFLLWSVQVCSEMGVDRVYIARLFFILSSILGNSL